MKKLFKTLAALAVVAALGFGFVSCGGGDDDSSSGGGNSGNGGSSTQTSTTATFKGKATVMGMTADVEVSFAADNTYLIKVAGENDEKGTYTLTGDFNNGTVTMKQTHSWKGTEWKEKEGTETLKIANGVATNEYGSYTKVASTDSKSDDNGNSGNGNGGGQTSIAVTTVSIDKTTAQEINITETVSFTATVTPNDASDKKVKWSVSGTGVTLYSDSACSKAVGAKATDTMTVYAKGTAAGTATVTVTSNADSSKTASCTVTVISKTYSLTVNNAENGTVTASTDSAIAGTEVTLTITPSNGYHLSTLSVKKGETNIVVANSKFTMPTGNVVVTATFVENYTNGIGIKAPSEAKAVGDIVFNDGTATPYTSDLTLTDAQKSAVVAVIFYAGSSTDVLGAKTLGVGIHNTYGSTDRYDDPKEFSWYPDFETGYKTNFEDIQCTPSISGSYVYGAAETATFTGDLDGNDNWAKICAIVTEAAAGYAWKTFSAFGWVNEYATKYSLTGDYASGWYLPTVAELSMLYRGVKDTVNAAIEKTGGEYLLGTYWSSSQSSSDPVQSWVVSFPYSLDSDMMSGEICDVTKKVKMQVCAIRAF